MPLSIKKPFIFIVGPTAVGKTEVSILLAERLNGEILSADSRLFYRGMNIGTAKPTESEQKRIKHHLIDVAEIDEIWSLAIYQKAAYRIAEEIRQKGKLPLVVGGTGQYVRALTEGWVIPSQVPDPTLRDAIKDWGMKIGASDLHAKLSMIDPQAAEKIEPGNLRRAVRAFEVIFSTGKLFSKQRNKKPVDFQYKIIGLKRSRQELYQRIDQRISVMFDTGFVEEVKNIISQGYDRNLPSLSAIGYKEVIMLINNEIEMEGAIQLIKRRTRQYVRRQANWFKESDPKIKWFPMSENVVDEIFSYIPSSEGWLYE